jgi:hypothetical protein
MINFHKRTAAGFTAGILFTGVLAVSAPASAHGPGGFHAPPTAGMSAPTGGGGFHPQIEQTAPPVMLSGSTTGRAVGASYIQPVGSTCYIKTDGYRRVRVCN